MGGIGSTRWHGHTRRPLAEQAMTIDLGDRNWRSALTQASAEGSIQWRNSQTETLQGWASYIIAPASGSGARRNLVLDTTGDEYEDKQVVELELGAAGWSIPRWLARCPKHCDRRAQKLYAVHQGDRFCCRCCSGLTHRSSQQHDARIDLARRDPAGFLASRSSAPRTPRSEMVTARLIIRALDRGAEPRRGRTWGARSTTAWSRAASELFADDLLKWNLAPEDAGKVARRG